MKIMIVEDDTGLCRGICLALAEQENEFVCCHCLKEARGLFIKEKPELMILDINLPDGSGYELLQEIREKSEIPILLLTANDLEVDEVTGLSLGADDYVTKPFSLAVLRARVEALKRRAKRKVPQVYRIDSFSFDFSRLLFYRGKEEIQLSRNEQKLLQLFLENQGRVLTREILVERLWTDGAEYVDENALSVTVNRLRKKLGNNGENYIHTVYGQGYTWKKE